MSGARIALTLGLGMGFLVLGAGPAPGHGWVLGLGGGSQGYNGPVGGGQLGPTTGSEPVPEATPSDPGPAEPAPDAPPVARGGGTGGGMDTAARGGRSGRPKAAKGAWMDRVLIPWEGRFMADANPGYETASLSVGECLRLSVAEGGWARTPGPTVVVEYDSSNRKHLAVLKILDEDTRICAAANLFNCFRVDTFGRKQAPKEIRLSVHHGDGSPAGEVRGDREARKVFGLLEDAWRKHSGSELTRIVPRVGELLGALAYFDYCREMMEAAYVCPDCGHERLDAMEKAAEFRMRRDSARKALEDLKKQA